MCVIFILNPGYTLPYEMLKNACLNNPHGYGIVIKRKNGLDIRKELPEDGNDPEVIYKILKDNEDALRYVHVRWKTQGDVSEENVQPFEVFNDNVLVGKKKVKRQVIFAHNGTLSQYSTTYSYGQQGVQPQIPVPSDSLRFSREVLRPFLPKLIGEKGVADISDPTVKMILDKYWPASANRGILICNNLDHMLFSESAWDKITTSRIVNGEEVKSEFLASNNDYFNELKRGPVYDKIKEEERKAAEAQRARNSAFSSSTTPKTGSVVNFTSPKFYEQYSFSEKITDLLEDHDMYKPEGYLSLANLTYSEWNRLISDASVDDLTAMMLYLTDFLKQAHDKLDAKAVTEPTLLQSAA